MAYHMAQSLTPSEYFEKCGQIVESLPNLIPQNLSDKRKLSVRDSFAQKQPILLKERNLQKNPQNSSSLSRDSNMKHIQELFLDMRSLKEEKNCLAEEIEFLLANFQYILELVEENITKFLSDKLGKIIKEKNQKISALNLKVEEFETKQIYWDKIGKQNKFLNQRIASLSEELERISHENYLYRQNFQNLSEEKYKLESSILMRGSDEILEEEDTNCKKDQRKNKVLSSNITRRSSSPFGVNKAMHESSKKRANIQNIKSLDKIKEKISKLKKELMNEY